MIFCLFRPSPDKTHSPTCVWREVFYSHSTQMFVRCKYLLSSSDRSNLVKAFDFRHRNMYSTCMGIMAKELSTHWSYQNYSESEPVATSDYTTGFQLRGFVSGGVFGVLGNFKPIFLPEGEEERFAFDLLKVIQWADLYSSLLLFHLLSRQL